MADGSLVVSDVLCFLVNKFVKTPVKLLKTVVTDFYSVDALADAKIRLLEDIKGMNLSARPPHVPLRRTGEGRLAHEVDDLLTLFTFIDESKLFDQLPTYVSSCPDYMPSLRLYEGDMQVLMAVIQSLVGKVDGFEATLAAIARDVKAIQVWPSLPEPSTSIGQRSAESRQTKLQQSSLGSTVVVSTRSADKQPPPSTTATAATDWASLTSTPTVHANRFALLSTDDDGQGDNEAPFTTVQRRTKRRRTQPTPTSSQQQQQQQQPSDAAPRRRRAPALRGRSTTELNIAAAQKFPRKSVFCVDNLNVNCSVEDLRDFVNSLSVEVITCFEVKPRRRRYDGSDINKKIGRKAFRLCINNDDRDKLMNAAAWPDSVTVAEWFFKPKMPAAETATEGVSTQPTSAAAGTSSTAAVECNSDACSLSSDTAIAAASGPPQPSDRNDNDDTIITMDSQPDSDNDNGNQLLLS